MLKLRDDQLYLRGTLLQVEVREVRCYSITSVLPHSVMVPIGLAKD